MNKQSLIYVVLIYLFSVTAFANPNYPTPTILVLGDSISAAYGMDKAEGWVNLLNNRLSENAVDAKVINASISGETTQGGLARLPQAMNRHQPNIVIIELGGNDGLRGYPLKRIRQNLTSLVSIAKENGAEVILAGMKIPPNYGKRYVTGFHGLYRQVAEEQNIHLVPFLLEGITPSDIQNDGIHPKATVQTLLLNNMWPVLQSILTPKTAQETVLQTAQ